MNCEGDMMIIDAMDAISGKQIAWNWIQEHKLNKLSDTITPDGKERIVLQQRKSVDPGYARINNETASKRRKMAGTMVSKCGWQKLHERPNSNKV